MAQIKTYSDGKQSKAQKIADEERRRESMQIAERKRQESLAAVADADIQKIAAEIVLEKEKNTIAPDIDLLMKHDIAKEERRKADESRLKFLMLEHRKGKKTFYVGQKMAFGAAMRDMERSQEAAKIAARLGVTNPITSSVMGVGTSSGMIMDKVRFVEAVCKMFAKRYRAIGSISAEDFESPIGT